MSNSLVASLTPFKGNEDSFEFFIAQINAIAKLEKWGETKKILVLKLNLKDEALKFLVSNPKLEEKDNFDSLVKKLEEKFCKKPNFEEAQRKFNNLKQKVSQSISDLAEQISSTTEKFSNPNNSEEENIVNLTEKLKLSKFIEALRPDIRVEVKKLGPKNFKSAVAIAKNIDNALSDDGAELNVTDSGINQILSQQLSTNKQILELSEKVNAISSQNLCVNSLTEAPATNSNNVQSYQHSPCQICGKLNHKANNCFHYTRGNYYRGNSRASYNRTFRANNFHPYRSRANQRGNYGRGFRVGNQKFDFEENSPTNVYSDTTDGDISENDKNKKESFEQINNNFLTKGDVSEETFHALNVKIANNITVQPFSTEIINLKVPKNILKNKDLIFIPKKNKLGYLINESLNVPTNANLFHTIIENNTNKAIHVRKNTIMGKLSTFDVNDIMSPSESEIYQINNLNLNEIHKMRKDELLKSDFKLDHLNDKYKKDMQDLLLKNYKINEKFDPERIKAFVEKYVGENKELVEALTQLIRENGKESLNKIHDILKQIIDKMIGSLRTSNSNVFEEIRDFFKDLGIEIRNRFAKFGEWVKEQYQKGLEKSKNRLENIKNIAKEFLEDTRKISRDVAEEALQFFREYKKDLGNIFDDVEVKVKDILRQD
ncbi:hypothetical protein AVEN_261484-1 [Araneus ventricosus]|uniref:Retrotransposon gag domain-containing protein n=2 Tax=Araneus ventricosus TaxID=182803 RepID=A0A4Y2S8D3_ARAVE|nr:hypothetical protein AVEN_250940-1 [Araneus ventricosus]GBN84313.1 hypothetical protein AVEN_261484-1 [Araneus ventricosus]